MRQAALFDAVAPVGPPGLRYEPEFLSHAEESDLLAVLAALPFREADYKQYTARRRIVSYGGKYDFTSNELMPAAPIPEWLMPLRERAAKWAGLEPHEFNHALVNEYSPGTPLGWHRDVAEFEHVIGVSLGSVARLRFRPYPPESPGRATHSIDVQPRSIYTMQGESRWSFQHAVSPTKELRYSITMRTVNPPRRFPPRMRAG